MECRRLLAIFFSDGVIGIFGVSSADTYLIDGSVSTSISVTENGAPAQVFDRTLVTSINAMLGEANDSFTVTGNVAVPITVDGDLGNDTIQGGSGNDTLRGNAGDDSILGGAGDDSILPGLGSDSIDGGNQADTLSYEDRSSGVSGTLNVTIERTDPPDLEIIISGGGTINGILEADTFDGFRLVVGGSGNDTLSVYGDDNDDSFQEGLWVNYTGIRPTFGVSGGAGADMMGAGTSLEGFQNALSTVPMFANGDGGDDTFNARLQSGSTLNGGAGNDSFSAGDDDATMPQVIGGEGIDFFEYEARAPNVTTETLAMSDSLENVTVHGASTFTIIGNDLDNDIQIYGRNVTINGGGGNDTIRSRAVERSFVRGDAGNDTIRIHDDRGIDVVENDRNDVDGGGGNDLIVINGGTDTVRGGDGNDSIYAGVGDDRVYGDAGNDRLNGDGGKDTMYGGDGDDRMYGNSGADRAFGDLGVDRLYGGNKNDYLDGGAGGDYVKGDEDTDTAKKDNKDRRYESIEIFV